MTTAIAAKQFDYGDMEPFLINKLEHLQGLLIKANGKHIRAVVEVGEHLHAVHNELAQAGCEGKFGAWVEAHCSYTKATAYNYMKAHDFFHNREKLMPLFDSSAVYKLCDKSTSSDVKKQAIKLAEKGTTVTPKVVKEIEASFEPEDEEEEHEIEDEGVEERVVVHDGLKQKVEIEELEWIFARAPEFKDYQRVLNEIKTWAEDIASAPVGKYLDLSEVRKYVKALKELLKFGMPYAVCPKCSGKRSNCKACAGDGFINVTAHKNFKRAGK